MSRLSLTNPSYEAQLSATLKRILLRARSKGDRESAVIAAAYAAKKTGKTYGVYQGNSHMHLVWLSSYLKSDYLNPINNTGNYVYEVTPDLDVTRYEVDRSEHRPNMNRRSEMAAIRAQQKAERAAKPKDPPLRKGDIVHVVGVLAGRYRGGNVRGGEYGPTLTHAIVQGHQKSLCGRIDKDNLADGYAARAIERPTCELCDKRLGSHPITLYYDTFYVWEMMPGSDEPLTKPSGPWSWDRARDQAEAWAQTSSHDFVVSNGDEPESVSFKLEVRYLARSGQAVRI